MYNKERYDSAETNIHSLKMVTERIPSSWGEAVKVALERYSLREKTVVIERGKFLNTELAQIVANTQSVGRTPGQTVSRVLQELRDERYLFFSSAGEYILNQVPISVIKEDLPEDVLDNAIDEGRLIIDDVETTDQLLATRVRKGVGALRRRTLLNYRNCCALCDIDDSKLLVTSHISRWADRPLARGLLSNTICFCTLHDKLFEAGYFSLSDKTEVLWDTPLQINAIKVWKEQCTGVFKLPQYRHPDRVFISEHRARVLSL